MSAGLSSQAAAERLARYGPNDPSRHRRRSASPPLLITTPVVVAVGALLPFTGLATPLGFEPLPGPFYAFVIAATLLYLVLVQLAKRRLLGAWSASAR